jgi:DNA repair exonuclease SbcCD ATPase subunit
MDPRTQTLRQWWTAQSDSEATEAVIALAEQEVTTVRGSDNYSGTWQYETGEPMTEGIEEIDLERVFGQVRSGIIRLNTRVATAEDRVELLKAETERLRDVRDILTQARQALIDLGTWEEVATCAATLTKADNDLRAAKATELPVAKERLSDVEAEATLQGYADGAIDGKNAEQRKSQLDAYLAKNEAVRAAREHLRAVETRVTNLEAALAVAEAEHKTALLRWNAARTQAELLAAMLAAVSGKG